MIHCLSYERNPRSIGCKHCQKLKKDHKPVTKPAARHIVVNVVKPFVGKPFNPAAIAAHHDAVVAASWLVGMATPAPAIALSPRLRVLCVLDGVEADHKVLDHFDDEAARLEDEAECSEDATNHAVLAVAAEAAKRRRDVAEKKLSARLASAQIAGIDLDVSEDDGPIDDVHGEVKVGTSERTGPQADAFGRWVKVADYDLVLIDNEQPRLRYLAAAAELSPSRVAFVANVKAERQTGEGQRRRQVIPVTITAILRRIGDLVADRRRQLLLPWGTEVAYPPAPSPDDAAVDEAIVCFAQA